VTSEELATISDDIVKYVSNKHPMELYETGALLLSIGAFLTANAIPDLWPQLKPTASLAHQLLDQEKMKEKSDTTNRIITL
jgi:hypothetical protein